MTDNELTQAVIEGTFGTIKEASLVIDKLLHRLVDQEVRIKALQEALREVTEYLGNSGFNHAEIARLRSIKEDSEK